ncbi:MAG: hypothetical protein IB618_00965 [Candidatus Pacearchaeota archaeon]|nr:MAG: hypothetical protein IB618_00965 [Candidatus Pacearchaeota archaeon]
MRFPITTEKTEFESTNFVNLSEALQESLQDMDIINPKTYEAKQKYFDLPIEEGLMLKCLSKFFDLTSNFHVGCSADIRPPSFAFYMFKGSADTREGAFNFYYRRMLKLSTFLENTSFRNERGVRDLESLARAYNQRENYGEKIGISWNGWTGDEDKQFGKTGFSGANISLEFDSNFLKEFDGVDDLSKEPWAFKSPLYGKCTPFYQLAKNTKLAEIIKEYHKQKEKLNHYHPQFILSYNLSILNYSIDDVLFGIFQVANKIFSTKEDIETNKNIIIESCSSYIPAPENFDFYKENHLYFKLGGGNK